MRTRVPSRLKEAQLATSSDSTRHGTPMITRFDAETWGTVDHLPEIRHALQNGMEVGFVLVEGDADDLFRLRLVRDSVQVRGRAGVHVGTYADTGVAVQAGWDSPWWHEAEP